MPRIEGFEGGTATPEQVQPTPNLPPVAPMGPFIPGLPREGTNAPAAVRGRMRFEQEVNAQKFASGVWGHDFNQWVLSLAEDPSDPEYNAVLQWAKTNARRHEAGSGSLGAGPAKADPNSPFALPEGVGQQPTSGDPGGVGPSGQSASGPDTTPPEETPGPLTPEEEKRQLRERAKLKDDWRAPVFRGRPVGTDELYQPLGPQDAYLDGFLSENGIALPGDDRNKALRSGKYVYMGPEHNAELGVSRDVFMYVEDAQAAATDLDSGLISGYQKALGLQETGRMDPYLVQYWDKAVEMAARYAQAGHKVSVREIFDIYVQSAIAQKNAAGGRGGGGGGGSGQDLEAWDYYRAMMQVLGDISGVGGGEI